MAYGVLIRANNRYVNPVDKPEVILIAGPTASGKSALALALAERCGGIIINADSMQVYRDLRIITARPTAAEEEKAPHRLYGHVDAADNYSVGRWCREAGTALAAARADARAALLVGGTGPTSMRSPAGSPLCRRSRRRPGRRFAPDSRARARRRSTRSSPGAIPRRRRGSCPATARE